MVFFEDFFQGYNKICQKWYVAKCCGFFALHSVNQGTSFELSKSIIRQFFFIFFQGQGHKAVQSKQVSLDLFHPTNETRLVLRRLGKMPFKNRLSKVLALNLAFWPLPIVRSRTTYV